MTDELRKYLKKVIEDVTGISTYFIEANNEAEMPYLVFDLIELPSTDFNRHTYELEVNAWNKHSPKEIISVIDELDKEFEHYYDNTDEFVIGVYNGTRMFVEDKDKTIKRIRRTYDVQAFSKKGE